MNSDIIVRESLVVRPFEARTVSNELKARVLHFQKLLSKQKRIKTKSLKIVGYKKHL